MEIFPDHVTSKQDYLWLKMARLLYYERKSNDRKEPAMKSVLIAAKKKHRRMKTDKMKGPSHFEVEYLRQVREELELFLRSRNVNTIKEIDIEFVGSDYFSHVRVSA